MDIRELHPTSKDIYEPYAQIYNAVLPTHPTTAGGFYDEDSRKDDKFVQRRFIINIDGNDVAIMMFAHMAEMHDPQRFYGDIMVLPEERNKGVGGQVYDALVDILKRDHNANEIHMWTTEDRPYSIHFLEKRGYKETMREWESRLPLAKFDARSFGDWRGRIAHNNVILKSWTELQDDNEALRKLHALETSLEEDVPTSQDSTEVPFETWLKHRTSDNVDFLPDAYYVAIHGDEYVGMSNIWANQGTKNLYVGLTGVLPKYRRKGIALALKTEVNLWAKAQGYEQIITWNELNNPMFDLNIKLGFIKQPAEIQFIKRLDA